MVVLDPFEPDLVANTANIVVSASSQNVQLPGRGERQILVTNDGTATVWIRFGASGVTTASSTGIPIPAGSAQVFTIRDIGANGFVAAIAAGATGTVYFTPGIGI